MRGGFGSLQAPTGIKPAWGLEGLVERKTILAFGWVIAAVRFLAALIVLAPGNVYVSALAQVILSGQLQETGFVASSVVTTDGDCAQWHRCAKQYGSFVSSRFSTALGVVT